MKALALLLCLFFCFPLIAQIEGVVTYEEIRQMRFKAPPEFADLIPKRFKRNKILTFSATESIYKNAPIEDYVTEDIERSQGNRRRGFQRMRANDVTYKNFKSGEVIEKQNFMGRDFLIRGSEAISWKVTGDQKMIGQYMCMKATYMRDTIPVVAWFTPQIPVSAGPGNLGKLPGLILEVDVDDGLVVTSAVDIQLRPLKEEEIIEVPEKGKELSREEFNQIRKEKMEELREMGGGRFMMRRGN